MIKIPAVLGPAFVRSRARDGQHERDREEALLPLLPATCTRRRCTSYASLSVYGYMWLALSLQCAACF